MKKYHLAATDYRGTVDLQQFSFVIEEAVHDIMPETVRTLYYMPWVKKILLLEDVIFTSPF